ncbi:ABC transporter ATP-binding protein [Paracoccus litorisediminis]|uniref:ATP-binding cassette domain-containing protein n=1 Tax=Paracoccus litorisediminis TaxID=2006130 RepID=A0A844HTS6_9RHOB|nr:ABC transporter ATP-binding protein [Paracoccus litorisediminis]MTH61635.1 ATP-binding cassette domain-containing protein [Paracoccus litorisediminis]
MNSPLHPQKVGVSIRNAVKRYGTFKALDDVSLDVAPGEFLSVLGPSGSGKTTLLGLLGGFVQPTSGSIHLGATDITYTPPHLRGIGIVFQNYALFPHMTVGENITFPLRARRLPKAEWPAKLQAALEMVELSGYADRAISALSGGQRQRVALARAMIFEPRLILMDEPLSALDKQLRENMQLELKQLHAKLGATIIYVTHDQREALTMSDRIAVMKSGGLVQVDTPKQLHDRPKDSFVASFIGEAMLLPVQRLDAGNLTLAGQTLRSAHPLPSSDDLFLTVHSEKLAFAGPQTAPESNLLPGTVNSCLYQGESVRIFVTLSGGEQVSLRLPSNHSGWQMMPEAGQPVTLALHPEDTIVVPRAA